MSFDATDFLGELFGDRPAAVERPAKSAADQPTAPRLVLEPPEDVASAVGKRPLPACPDPLARPTPRQFRQPGEGPCNWCHRFAWWRSVYGVVVCGRCHPPAVPGLAREWLEPKAKDS